jgi:hypothetical protein
MRPAAALFVAVSLLGIPALPAEAQPSARRCVPDSPVTNHNDLLVIRSCTERETHRTTTSTGTSGEIVVMVHGLAEYRRAYWAAATRDPQLDPANLILYFDGRPLPRLAPAGQASNESHLAYDLRRMSSASAHPDALAAWKTLLADGIRDRHVRLSVGFPTRGPLNSEVDDFEIDALGTVWLWVWIVLTGVVVGLVIWAGWTSDLLRVPGEAPEGKSKAFSLGRVQMAAWFFVVLCAWTFIYLVTGVMDSLSPTVLGLMGISAATGLAATVIDVSNSGTAESQGLLLDLVQENKGMSLARLQIIIWTAVLIFVFGRTVAETLNMPEFNATLLGLMGISGGTYLGFKVPDSNATAASAVPPASPAGVPLAPPPAATPAPPQVPPPGGSTT